MAEKPETNPDARAVNLPDDDLPDDAAAFRDQCAKPVLRGKQDLRPGDLLLTVNTRAPKPLLTRLRRDLIQAGQAMPGRNSTLAAEGLADRVHAAIWVHTPGNPARTGPWAAGEAEVAEALKGIGVRTRALEPDLLHVFRPADANMADWAAQIAQIWAEHGRIAYSSVGAASTMTHSAAPGLDAAYHLAVVQADAFEPDPLWAMDGSFCSQFVLNAYQAACLQVVAACQQNAASPAFHNSTAAKALLDSAQTLLGALHSLQALQTDPRHASPCLLDHLCKTHPGQFADLGLLEISAAGQAYVNDDSPSLHRPAVRENKSSTSTPAMISPIPATAAPSSDCR